MRRETTQRGNRRQGRKEGRKTESKPRTVHNKHGATRSGTFRLACVFVELPQASPARPLHVRHLRCHLCVVRVQPPLQGAAQFSHWMRVRDLLRHSAQTLGRDDLDPLGRCRRRRGVDQRRLPTPNTPLLRIDASISSSSSSFTPSSCSSSCSSSAVAAIRSSSFAPTDVHILSLLVHWRGHKRTSCARSHSVAELDERSRESVAHGKGRNRVRPHQRVPAQHRRTLGEEPQRRVEDGHDEVSMRDWRTRRVQGGQRRESR